METFKTPIIGLVSAMGALFIWILFAPSAGAQTIASLPASEASKIVAVRNANVQGNVVSGELINMSPHRVRDVELLIRNVWHWRNEFRPGANPPGSADFYTVRAEIPSGATERFTYTLALPPSTGSDGDFETVVTVAGFTEIIEDSQEQKNINDWRPLS